MEKVAAVLQNTVYVMVNACITLVIVLAGVVAGAVVATMSFVVLGFPHLHGLSVYQLQFWCPYGYQTGELAKILWSGCVVSGFAAGGMAAAQLLFPPNWNELSDSM